MKLITSMAALAALGAAQDPRPPVGGFPIQSTKDSAVTWSDGYKTLLDAYYPDPTQISPPTTGWPAVLVIHGKGGKRGNATIVRRCTYLARLGYVTLAYDVRGDGDTVRLNPGKGNGNSSRRVLDVAEAYFLTEGNLKGLMDDARLGITGWSMGGGFTMDAVSFSGQTLPLGGYVKAMPKIGAAIPDIQILDRPDDQVPGGVLFQARAAQRAFDRDPNSALVNAIVAGQYSQVRGFYDRDPVQARGARLAKAEVPLLVCFSQGDVFHFSNQNTDGFANLKPGVPWRYHLTTGGHGTPTNDLEDEYEQNLVGRWCDRFLKGFDNGVDREAKAEVALVPTTFQTWQNRTSQWKHRLYPQWPPRTSPTRLYLRPGTGALGRLLSAAPTQNEGPFTIAHRVRSGYDARGFLTDRGNPQRVNPKIPLRQVAFQLAAANEERELAGRAVVSFDVTTRIANLQLSASLFDVDPNNNRRWITSGFAAKRGVSAGTHRFTITLEEIPYVLPAGHRLRLWIHNVPARLNGSATHYLYLPEFVDEDYRIVTSAASPATLDLPLARSTASMRPRFATASAASAIRMRWRLDGEVSRKGMPYVTVFGASGIVPTLTDPVRLYVRLDDVTSLFLAQLNSPLLPATVGVLDASGVARPGLDILDPALRRLVIGTRFEAAAVGFSTSGFAFASMPASLRISK